MPDLPLLYGGAADPVPMMVETRERTVLEPIPQDVLQGLRADVGEDGGFLVPPEVASSLMASLAASEAKGYSLGPDGEMIPCYLTEEPISSEDWLDINDF